MIRFLLASILLLTSSLSATHYGRHKVETYLILNMENKHELPRNFRTTLDPLPANMEVAPSLVGLDLLNASGSGQFSVKSLETMIETIPHNNIIILDLREEPHGMMNDMAITWYSDKNWTNIGLSRHEIDLDLHERIQHLKENPPTSIFKSKAAEHSMPVTLETINTEEESVIKLGLRYYRITARDHTRPSDQAVDDFIQFVKSMDSDTWIHFHCSAGRGRTTTFMTLFDIIRNGQQVSLDDIVKRQDLIGGLDLFAVREDEWKNEHAQIRGELVKDFYQYCLEHPNFDISWSQWLEAKNGD